MTLRSKKSAAAMAAPIEIETGALVLLDTTTTSRGVKQIQVARKDGKPFTW